MSVIYSIEGNIGSGKSTFVKILKQMYTDSNKYIFMEEPVEIWETIQDKNGTNIIEKFYKEQDKYAFSFQMMAYISRLSMLRKIVKENPNKIIICERSLYTDKNVFAKMLYDSGKIEEVEYQIYTKWFDEFIGDLPETKTVYVQVEPQISHSRVLKRQRKGENIPLEYLKSCHEYHEKWLNNEQDVLVLNGNEDKTITVESYFKWIKELERFCE
jgi:deoxyadenosine/deoxycytidine kinase